MEPPHQSWTRSAKEPSLAARKAGAAGTSVRQPVSFAPKGDVVVETSGPLTVALDTEVDDDLRREGLARELVRAINDLRKERGLELADRIRVALHATGDLAEAARRHGDWIAGEVLAVGWTVAEEEPAAGSSSLSVDGAVVGVDLVVEADRA